MIVNIVTQNDEFKRKMREFCDKNSLSYYHISASEKVCSHHVGSAEVVTSDYPLRLGLTLSEDNKNLVIKNLCYLISNSNKETLTAIIEEYNEIIPSSSKQD